MFAKWNVFDVSDREETLRKNSLKDIFDVTETLTRTQYKRHFLEETLKRKQSKRYMNALIFMVFNIKL